MGHKKLLFIIMLLFVPFVLSASTFSDAQSKANKYHNNFDTFDRYLRKYENYGFNGSIVNVPGFETGGFISYKEFEISKNGKESSNSYLFQGI